MKNKKQIKMGSEKERQTMEEIKIYCHNEKKIEAILKYLFGRRVRFDIVGRRAVLVYNKKDCDDLFSDEWFEVEEVKNFPEECWRDMKRTKRFQATIPEKFVPVDIPRDQEPLPEKYLKTQPSYC